MTTPLSELSGAELAELARIKARERREADDRLGTMMDDLFKVVDQMAKRLDEAG